MPDDPDAAMQMLYERQITDDNFKINEHARSELAGLTLSEESKGDKMVSREIHVCALTDAFAGYTISTSVHDTYAEAERTAREFLGRQWNANWGVMPQDPLEALKVFEDHGVSEITFSIDPFTVADIPVASKPDARSKFDLAGITDLFNNLLSNEQALYSNAVDCRTGEFYPDVIEAAKAGLEFMASIKEGMATLAQTANYGYLDTALGTQKHAIANMLLEFGHEDAFVHLVESGVIESSEPYVGPYHEDLDRLASENLKKEMEDLAEFDRQRSGTPSP